MVLKKVGLQTVKQEAKKNNISHALSVIETIVFKKSLYNDCGSLSNFSK